MNHALKRLFTCVFALTTLAPFAAASADDVTRNDIPKLDIFNIRLYDSADEVLAKIHTIDPQALNLSAFDHPKLTIENTKCVPARGGTNATYLKRCPGTITFTTTKFALTAEMVEDLPDHPGSMRAYSVTLQSRSLGSSFIDLTPIARQKYGTPTLQQANNLGYCAHPQSAAPASCQHDEPSLTLTDGQTLVLADFGFQAAKLQAATSHLHDVNDHSVRF